MEGSVQGPAGGESGTGFGVVVVVDSGAGVGR